MRRLLALSIVLVVAFAGAATVPRSADAVVPGAVGQIVFWSDRDMPQGELYTRDFTGGTWERLTWNTAYERESAWSPDGSAIAYSLTVSGPSAIWVMNRYGDLAVPVASDSYDNTEPTWSPDGSRIAYTSDHTASRAWDVWVMNANGSGKTNLIPLTVSIQDSHPAWSPDGSKIAFASNRAGSPDVYVMNTDGSNVTNLTNNTAWWDYDPTWSRGSRSSRSGSAAPRRRSDSVVRCTPPVSCSQ